MPSWDTEIGDHQISKSHDEPKSPNDLKGKRGFITTWSLGQWLPFNV